MKNLVLSLLIKAKDKAGTTISGLKSKISSLGKKSSTAAKGTEKLNQSLGKSAKLSASAKLGFLGLTGVVAGVALAFGRVVRSAKEWIAKANVQERAETKLATTLRNLSNATDEEIEALTKQASALQDVTGYGDEATISAQAMLGTFKLSAKEIGVLTPRLLDMAESARKAGDAEGDLESVSIALGKAFSSGIGSLSRYGIAMSDVQKEAFKLADQEEKVNILAEVLDGNFKGLAEAVGKTYEGAVRKASAAHGDFHEKLGNQIKDNPQVVGATNDITQAFKEMGQGVVDSSEEIGEAISFLAKGVRLSFAGIKAVWNVAEIGFKGLVLTINTGIQKINEGLALITFGDVSKEFKAAAEELKQENEKMRISIVDDMMDIDEAGNTVVKVIDGIGGEVRKIPSLVRELGKATKEASREIDKGAESGNALAEALDKVGVKLDEIKTGLKTEVVDQLRAMGLAMGDTSLEGDNLVDTLLAIAEESDSPIALAKAYEYVTQAAREGRISAEQEADAIRDLSEMSDKAAKSLDGLSKSYDGKPTREEIDGVIAKLQELAAQGQISQAEMQAGISQAEAQYQKMGQAAEESGDKVVKAEKASVYEQQVSSAKRNTIVQQNIAASDAQAKAAEESAERQKEAYRNVASGLGDSLAQAHRKWVGQMAQLSEVAEKTLIAVSRRTSKQWANSLDFVDKWSGVMRETMSRLRSDWGAANTRLERMMEIIGKGQVSLQQLAGMGSYAAQWMGILGKEKLTALNAAIQQARDNIEGMNASAKETLQGLKDELAQLNGQVIDTEQRRNEQRKADLEAKLAEAEANSGKDLLGRTIQNQATKDLQEALRLLEQINRKRQQTNETKAAAQDMSKSVQAGVEAALGGKLAKVDIGGIEVLAPESSIDLLKKLQLSRMAS